MAVMLRIDRDDGRFPDRAYLSVLQGFTERIWRMQPLSTHNSPCVHATGILPARRARQRQRRVRSLRAFAEARVW